MRLGCLFSWQAGCSAVGWQWPCSHGGGHNSLGQPFAKAAARAARQLQLSPGPRAGSLPPPIRLCQAQLPAVANPRGLRHPLWLPPILPHIRTVPSSHPSLNYPLKQMPLFLARTPTDNTTALCQYLWSLTPRQNFYFLLPFLIKLPEQMPQKV